MLSIIEMHNVSGVLNGSGSSDDSSSSEEEHEILALEAGPEDDSQEMTREEDPEDIPHRDWLESRGAVDDEELCQTCYMLS